MQDLVGTKVTVNGVHSEEQGLRPEFEVVVDLNHPVHKGRSDGLVQLLLGGHVTRIGIPPVLVCKHGLLNLLAELGDMVDVVESPPVGPAHVAEDLVLAPLFVHLQLLVEADAWQSLSGVGLLVNSSGSHSLVAERLLAPPLLSLRHLHLVLGVLGGQARQVLRVTREVRVVGQGVDGRSDALRKVVRLVPVESVSKRDLLDDSRVENRVSIRGRLGRLQSRGSTGGTGYELRLVLT